jgi:hypothetical protein
MSEKPSHATVPLNPSVNGKSVWSIAQNGLLLETQCGQNTCLTETQCDQLL